MSTVRTWQTQSTSLDETLRQAAAIGRELRGGELIELTGDLGSGKTAFVKGLASGMGSPDLVHSPSFTLSNRYSAGGLALHHFDFYRLAETGLMRHEIAEALADPKAVVVVEWANVVADVLPAKRLTINLTANSASGRKLTVIYPDSLSYLLPAKVSAK